MAKIWYGTHFVSGDEPCLGLYEISMQSPWSRGFHRYQIVLVMRNDKPTEYRMDMGLAKKYKGIDQLRIPGGARDGVTGRFYIEHTVNELREIANQVRNNPPFDKRELVGVEHIRN